MFYKQFHLSGFIIAAYLVGGIVLSAQTLAAETPQEQIKAPTQNLTTEEWKNFIDQLGVDADSDVGEKMC